eukprot:symbB.v1.2.022092.t2/scaffold1946.1/size95412/4
MMCSQVRKLVVVVASQVTEETLERWTFDVQVNDTQAALAVPQTQADKVREQKEIQALQSDKWSRGLTRKVYPYFSSYQARSAQKEVIETKRKAEPSPSGLSEHSNVLWRSNGSRYSKKPKQGRSPVEESKQSTRNADMNMDCLGLSPSNFEHVHDEAYALIISDEEMEAMPTTPRFCALDQCGGNGEHAGCIAFQEFSSDAGSPIMHHGTRMSPPPLSPLSESCGEYQNEEDFYVYEVNLFPILCWQEEPMLRHPASEDTLPIEVPRWSFWSYCRNFGSFSNQKAEDERRKLVSAMVRADRRIWNIQEIFEYDDKKGLFLGVSIFDECLIKEQPRLRPSVLAAVALGIGEKFEEADSDRDRLHLVYEAGKMSNPVVSEILSQIC